MQKKLREFFRSNFAAASFFMRLPPCIFWQCLYQQKAFLHWIVQKIACFEKIWLLCYQANSSNIKSGLKSSWPKGSWLVAYQGYNADLISKRLLIVGKGLAETLLKLLFLNTCDTFLFESRRASYLRCDMDVTKLHVWRKKYDCYQANSSNIKSGLIGSWPKGSWLVASQGCNADKFP